MITRKLQSIGGSSLSLTLPKDWADENQLRSKDLLILEKQTNGSLTIRKDNKVRKIYSYRLYAEKMSMREVAREIVGAYMAGADELVIEMSEFQTGLEEAIKKTVGGLMGEEIVESSGEKIVVRNLLDHGKLSTSEAVEKMFVVTRGMVEEVYEAVIAGEANLVKGVMERDNDVDSLYGMVCRQMMVAVRDGIARETANRYPFFYYNLGINLERIADHAVNIGRYYLQDEELSAWLDERMPKVIWSELTRMLKDAQLAVREKNKSLAHRILNQDESLQRELRVFGMTKYQKKPSFALILTSLWRVRGYVTNIAELTMNYVIEQTMRTVTV